MSRLKIKLMSTALAVALWNVPAISADLSAAPKEMPAEAKVTDSLIGFSFYTQYASDYLFRGVSISDRRGSWQNFFEVQYFDNFLYTGFYSWQVRLPTDPDFELDLVAGIRPKFGNFTFDLGVLYYFYPNERRVFSPAGVPLTTANSDFIEYAGKVLYQATPELALGANIYYAPSFFGQHATSTYASGTIAYTLPATWFPYLPESVASGFTISGEGGHNFLGAAKTSATGFVPVDLPSYSYGNAGVSWTYKNLLLDLRYHVTDLDKKQCFTFTGDLRGYNNGGRSNWCGDTVVGTARWQFSTAQPGVFAESNFLEAFFK